MDTMENQNNLSSEQVLQSTEKKLPKPPSYLFSGIVSILFYSVPLVYAVLGYENMIEEHLAIGLIIIMLCGLIPAVISIYKAVQVSRFYNTGQYEDALECSENALKWGYRSIIVGLVSYILGMLYLFLVFLPAFGRAFRN